MQKKIRKTILDSAYISDYFKNTIWPLYAITINTQVTRSKHSTAVYKICERYKKDFLELTHEDVQDYFNCLTNGTIRTEKGDYYSTSSVRTAFFQLFGLANFIIENADKFPKIKYINAFAFVELSERKLEFKKEDLHSVKDMSALLSYLHGSPYYLMVSMVYRLGISAKELVSLKIRDLYYDAKDDLYIKVPVEAPVIKAMEKEPRIIKVPKDLEKTINDYVNSLNQNQIFFFVTSRQTPYNINTLSNKMRVVFDNGGFADYTLQTIRNAGQYALLTAAGMEHSKEVTAQFGITERYIKRYTDAIEDSALSISDKLQVEIAPTAHIKREKKK